MKHESTFDLTVGGALIAQFEVMAEIKSAGYGDWCVETVYADAMEKDGKRCTQSRDWEEIPKGHFMHDAIVAHFEYGCEGDIDNKWAERRPYRYQSTISAGRTL